MATTLHKVTRRNSAPLAGGIAGIMASPRIEGHEIVSPHNETFAIYIGSAGPGGFAILLDRADAERVAKTLWRQLSEQDA